METATVRTKCHVSKRLSRIMKISQLSSYSCSLSKTEYLFDEYLFSSIRFLCDMPEWISGGSVAEGTATADSDIDQMIIMPGIMVHTANKKPGVTKDHRFLLDQDGSSPGYGRLRVLDLENGSNQTFNKIASNIQDFLEGKFLSSEKFVKYFVFTKSTDMSECYRHGPCATRELKDVHDNVMGYVMGKPGIKVFEDLAHVLVCDEWPAGAQKWITRKRIHDWPPKEIIEKISKMKCHAVPVGNKRSSNFSLEWRISFSLGERELVWNFNDTQVQCYILLKQLIKKHIEPVAPDQLSSYHIKTIMFWMAEDQGMSMWYEENLLGCVTDCLEKLSYCVKTRTLLHYFDRQRNLLDNKLDSESDKKSVLQGIKKVQVNIEQYVSECVEDSDISSKMEMCNTCDTLHMNFLMCGVKICDLDGYVYTVKTNDAVSLYGAAFNICLSITLYDDIIPTYIDFLVKWLETNPPEDVNQQILKLTKIFAGIRFGMGYFCQAKKNDTSVEDVYTKLCQGRNLDSLSGILYLASIYFWEDKVSSSNNLVLTALRQDKVLLHPSSYTSMKNTIHLTKEGHSKIKSSNHFIGKGGIPHYAFDVIFSSKDANCVPYPVKFECVLAKTQDRNYVIIHPCIYAHFLLCVGQLGAGQNKNFANTLNQLDQLVCELGHGIPVYRALNLLGYCYSLAKNVNAALRCYSSSLGLTQSSPMIKNAAVYHICIILAKYLNVPSDREVLYERLKTDS